MKRKTTIVLPIAVALIGSVIATPASASRFGASGPPGYKSYPYGYAQDPLTGDIVYGRGMASQAPADYVTCAEDPTPAPCDGTPASVAPYKYVWKVPPELYNVSNDSYIIFYSFRNAISPNVNDGEMPAPGGAGPNDWFISYQGHAAKAEALLNDDPDDPDGLRLQAMAGELEDQFNTVGHYFDFDRPSFTQDVDVVPPDFKSPDTRVLDYTGEVVDAEGNVTLQALDMDGDGDTEDGYVLESDYNPSAFTPDAVDVPSLFQPAENAAIDGTANLFKFGFTVAPGTQFMNMQVDRNGNYYVARRDMQWDWIDRYEYQDLDTGERTSIDTQFNIKPYPVSDAYGWCGAIPPEDPNSLLPMAGQLIKDIAFDVYLGDREPWQSPAFSTEVVPSFLMRSYGIWVVDVTMNTFGGTRQRFSSMAKGVHVRAVDTDADDNGVADISPVTGDPMTAGSIVEVGDPDYSYWRNRVSPFAAGVVPAGAWVLNEGNPEYLQVVPPGTPGAVWHQNKFAGAAFLVRGDMERRVNYIQLDTPWAGDQSTVADDTMLYKQAIDDGDMERSDWTDWDIFPQIEVLADAH